MRTLRWVTLAVMAGLCATFVIRVASTLLPFVFRSAASLLPLIFLEFLAGLAMALFFVLFLTEFDGVDRPVLRGAAILAIVGALAGLTGPIRFLTTWGLGIRMHLPVVSALSDGLIPLAGSLALLVFFAVFRLQMNDAERRALGLAAIGAATGYGVRVLIQIAVLVRLLLPLGGRLPGFPSTLALVLLPLHALTFALALNFFVQFYLTILSNRKAEEAEKAAEDRSHDA